MSKTKKELEEELIQKIVNRCANERPFRVEGTQREPELVFKLPDGGGVRCFAHDPLGQDPHHVGVYRLYRHHDGGDVTPASYVFITNKYLAKSIRRCHARWTAVLEREAEQKAEARAVAALQEILPTIP